MINLANARLYNATSATVTIYIEKLGLNSKGKADGCEQLKPYQTSNPLSGKLSNIDINLNTPTTTSIMAKQKHYHFQDKNTEITLGSEEGCYSLNLKTAHDVTNPDIIIFDMHNNLVVSKPPVNVELPSPLVQNRQANLTELAQLAEDDQASRPQEVFGPVEDVTIEAIVLKHNRPVLLVQDQTFKPPANKEWQQILMSAKHFLESAIPAVGRIELRDHPDYTWVGTGWLVAPNIVVTNRHVAKEFAVKQGKTFDFNQFHSLKVRASIDFRREYQRNDVAEIQIEKILHIEDDNGPDIAFLKLASSSNQPKPIKLSPLAQAGRNVAVVGYPAMDSRRNDPAVMADIFAGIYDYKRLQPGRIFNVEADILEHDCSTLGGNSGSVVIDLHDGTAAGLHFSGKYLKGNSAIPATVINEKLKPYLESNDLTETVDTETGNDEFSLSNAWLSVS